MYNSLKLLAKIIITIICLFFAYRSCDIVTLFDEVKNINPLLFIFALLSVFLGQIFASMRLRYYYQQYGINLGVYFSIAIHFMGLFYNSFMPSGLVGDVYKLYFLSKLKNISKITSLRIMLSNRASGLFVLCVILTLLCYSLVPNKVLLLSVSAFIVVSYFVSAKLLLKEDVKSALTCAINYSSFVQLFSIISAVMIYFSLNGDFAHLHHFIVIFLFTAITSFLPISIGGVGVRELTFMYCSKFLVINVTQAMAFSMVYFLCNLLITTIGIYFIFRMEKISEEEQGVVG